MVVGWVVGGGSSVVFGRWWLVGGRWSLAGGELCVLKASGGR